jgi:hypothetical protein
MLADVGPTTFDTSTGNFPVLASLRSTNTCHRTIFATVLVLEMNANSSSSASPLSLAVLTVEPDTKKRVRFKEKEGIAFTKRNSENSSKARASSDAEGS